MDLNLPVYDEYFKFFIVEEIALERNIEKIHYGKCSVIGYLSSCDCLQSISIPNLEKLENFITKIIFLLILFLFLENTNYLTVQLVLSYLLTFILNNISPQPFK